MPIENVTPNRGYQLPHAANDLIDDVSRLIAGLLGVDLDVANILAALLTKADKDHEHVIADIVGLAAALSARQETAAKGQANGYASLGSDGKVPAAQLPSTVFGALSYQGAWNASTNSPTIPAANAGNKGHYYKVSATGTTTISGINDWEVGDWIVSNGTTWDKIDNTDQVLSVAGLRGAISAEALKGALSIGVADVAGLGGAATLNIGKQTGTVADGGAALQYQKALGGGEDLNTIREPGAYSQNQNAGAASGSNYPAPTAGLLEVIDGVATNVKTVQRYTLYSTGRLYWRIGTTSAWSAWKEAVTPDTLPPPPASANKRIYTSSATWTKPAGLSKVVVHVLGGGGGGGGSGHSSSGAGNQNLGGRGGGGGYAMKEIAAALLPATVGVQVGAGGNAGTAGGSSGGSPGGKGGTGGTSSFGTFCSASGGDGGTGGSGTTNGTAGTGGDGTEGMIRWSGNPDGASAFSPGQKTPNPTLSAGRPASAAGVDASSYIPGTGGSGGWSVAGTGSAVAGREGGGGSDGFVIVEEYF
ncbi:pyocin knob domain-containing protein [Aquamicrobium terrae]